MPDAAYNPLADADGDFVLPSYVSDNCALVQSGFGYGPFGHRDWLSGVIWNVLTTGRMRDVDADYDCAFRRWQYGCAGVLERLNRKARDLHHLTNGFRAPGRHNGIEIVIQEYAQSDDWLIVTLALDGNLQASGVDLTPVNESWELVTNTGSRFAISAVRKNYMINTARAATGTVFSYLYEIDVAATYADITTGCRLEPRDSVSDIGASYGISVVAGMKHAMRQSMVGRLEAPLRIKGTTTGMKTHARQRGFTAAPAALNWLDADHLGSFALVTGEFPWIGFRIATGDGTANAADSDSDLDTVYGATDTLHAYATSHRLLGEGIGSVIGIGKPGSNGLTGTVLVTYTVLSADGEARTFHATDVRLSSSVGELVGSEDFQAAFPGQKLGRVLYDANKIGLVAYDQSNLSTLTVRPFANRSQVLVDFKHKRYYTLTSPQMMRFDDVKVDAMLTDVWKIPGTNDSAFEFALTTTLVVSTAAPFTSASRHTLSVTYTAGFSPIPAPSSPTYPTGTWKLTDGTTEWWVEEVTSTGAATDSLVVFGTIAPTTAVVTLVAVPPEASEEGFSRSAGIKVTMTNVATPASWYDSPDGAEKVRALAALKVDALAAHSRVIIEEL